MPTNMTIFKSLEYSCLRICNVDNVKVIDWICISSKLIFQPELNRHRTIDGKSKVHRTITGNQNKQGYADTTKSQKQTKNDWKYAKITYSIKKNKVNTKTAIYHYLHVKFHIDYLFLNFYLMKWVKIEFQLESILYYMHGKDNSTFFPFICHIYSSNIIVSNVLYGYKMMQWPIRNCEDQIKRIKITKMKENDNRKWCILTSKLTFALLIHLGWSSGIDLGSRSVLLLEVTGSIPSRVNLGGLIYLL